MINTGVDGEAGNTADAGRLTRMAVESVTVIVSVARLCHRNQFGCLNMGYLI